MPIALAIVFFCFSNSFAQHSLQVDDGLGHLSTIVASSPGGTYTFPAGSGQILSFSPGGVSPVWLVNGNATPPSTILGTLSPTNFLIQTNSITRLTFNNTPSASTPLLSIPNTTAGFQGVRINGSLDAVVGSTLIANPGVWDMVVDGDAIVTGIFKIGGSFWFDGNSLTHSITANKPLSITTSTNDSLMFGTNNTTRMTIARNGYLGIGTKNPVSPLHISANPPEPTATNSIGFLTPDPGNHILTVENQATNSMGNGIAVIIHNQDGTPIPGQSNSDGAYNNNSSNYVTFYNDIGDHTHIIGRIEGFSYENYQQLLQALIPIVSNTDIYNPFNYFTCNLGFNSGFINFDPNFIHITWPTFPTVSGGSWPTISSDFSFSAGSFPTFSGGSVGDISFTNPIYPWPPESPITGLSNPFSLNHAFIDDIASQLSPLPYKDKLVQIVSDPYGAALLFAVSFLSGITYESGSGDYAEWLERADHNEKINVGDVVGVFGGKISKNTEGTNQFMVASFKPCVLGNSPVEGQQPFYNKVAFMGQVPVKMLSSVRKGDYILPDGNNSGFATAVSPENMREDQLDKVLGVAWEDQPQSGPKFVKIAVGLKGNEMVKVIQDHASKINTLRAKVMELSKLKSEIADVKSTLESGQKAKLSAKKSKHSKLSSN